VTVSQVRHTQSNSDASVDGESSLQLWGCPASCNAHPLCETAAFFAFHVANIRVTRAAAAYSVFFRSVGSSPVLVLFLTLLLVFGRFLQKRNARQLSSWSIGRAMLDGGVAVANVAKVVNVSRCKKSTGSERMNGCITPLRRC
jgi:hypothetical protein